MLPHHTQRLQSSDLHEKRGSVEGVKMATWSVTKPNSLFTNPVCPHPGDSDPALKRPDCQQAGLRVQQLFDTSTGGGGGLKRRGGEVVTKAFCCSLGVGLPALLSAAGSNFTPCMCMHTHMHAHAITNLYSHAPLLQGFEGRGVCTWFLRGQMRFVCQAFRARHQDKSSHISKVLCDR